MIKYIFLIAFIGGCLNLYSQEAKSSLPFKYRISEKLITDWKKDRQGCLGLRSKYADSLKSNKMIVGLSKCMVFELFGLPDEDGKFVFSYYMDTYCDPKMKADKKIDFCQFSFVFNDDDGNLEAMVVECH